MDGGAQRQTTFTISHCTCTSLQTRCNDTLQQGHPDIAAMPRRLPSSHRYIRFAVSPPCTDALTLRKTIQDALGQSFGLVSSHTYVDVLWLADDGTAIVVRIGET